ncbi:MAG: protein translocase SEC61 complex subunit gamma [Thermoprotei archaeon]|nr:MAG: protein translocase SEC61 complex subunit gamma [Thermoprotei archaeon]
MGISDKFKKYALIIKFTKKPERREFTLTLKVVTLGFVLLGSIGFVFQLLGSALQFRPIAGVPRELIILGVISVIVLGLAISLYRYRAG